MNLTFPDERSGSDSKEYQPNAYIRGTKITFDQEAGDIIPGVAASSPSAGSCTQAVRLPHPTLLPHPHGAESARSRPRRTT
jgi:hypothetical protein